VKIELSQFSATFPTPSADGSSKFALAGLSRPLFAVNKLPHSLCMAFRINLRYLSKELVLRNRHCLYIR